MRRLAPFFQALRVGLTKLNPPPDDDGDDDDATGTGDRRVRESERGAAATAEAEAAAAEDAPPRRLCVRVDVARVAAELLDAASRPTNRVRAARLTNVTRLLGGPIDNEVVVSA